MLSLSHNFGPEPHVKQLQMQHQHALTYDMMSLTSLATLLPHLLGHQPCHAAHNRDIHICEVQAPPQLCAGSVLPLRSPGARNPGVLVFHIRADAYAFLHFSWQSPHKRGCGGVHACRLCMFWASGQGRRLSPQLIQVKEKYTSAFVK